MSVIRNELLLAGDDAYNIQRSLRFRSSASAYLNRTPSSASNRKTWTWSAWVKRGTLGTFQTLFCAGASDAVSPFETRLRFNDTDTLSLTINGNATIGGNATTSAVFRDPSSWYHIVAYVDMSASGQANKARLYVNGVLQTVSYANFGTTDDTQVNNNVIHRIAANSFALSGYFDGYMTEVNFIDGQALTPSSFGQNNAQTGVWQPKRYTGTYGTNGFYLPFSDNSSTTTLTQDRSGNGNNWTANNISLTSGATYDSMTDVPTLTSATQANFAVLNPLTPAITRPPTQGNLYLLANLSTFATAYSTIQVNSGKWYFEVTAVASGISGGGSGAGWFNNNTNTSVTGSLNTGSAGDVWGFGLDCSTATVTIYRNNTLQSTTTLGSVGDTYSTIGSAGASYDLAFNFGQRPFAYTPPTGFVALNTFNLPTPTIGATASTQANKYFDISLYTGNGASTRSITGINFQPDFIWLKNRSFGTVPILYDTVRGYGSAKELSSATTTAEGALGAFGTTADYGYVSSNSSNGFNTTNGALGSSYVNQSSQAYVGWQWNAGGSTVTNTSGSISSQVRANPSAGFSIVTYTGNGSAGSTIGHGLGVAPAMYIVKARNASGQDWLAYHRNANASPQNGVMTLNATSAFFASSVFWNNTAPTSSVFSVGTSGATNNNGTTYVAYCFSEVAGYSRFGSYTGNGSNDGPFVFCGFRPRYIMIKNASAAVDWVVYDTSRIGFNTYNYNLLPNSSTSEGSGIDVIDILSNGFKLRTTNSTQNGNGNTLIFMAFAENPFKYSLAR